MSRSFPFVTSITALTGWYWSTGVDSFQWSMFSALGFSQREITSTLCTDRQGSHQAGTTTITMRDTVIPGGPRPECFIVAGRNPNLLKLSPMWLIRTIEGWRWHYIRGTQWHLEALTDPGRGWIEKDLTCQVFNEVHSFDFYNGT